jgi:uncharacterized LabA/DUF88 family protein
MKKVARLYIDGFNFYYSIYNNKELHRCVCWCDFRKLAEKHLLTDEYELARIKYFTSLVGDYGGFIEQERQDLWLRAIKNIEGLEIIEGYHVKHPYKPREEKQTDVNIAVEMLMDAFLHDDFDKAILLSGDLDLAPAALAVAEKLPETKTKTVEVWMPPGQSYGRWKNVEKGTKVYCGHLSEDMLMTSRMPDEFRDKSRGELIRNIPEWRKDCK